MFALVRLLLIYAAALCLTLAAFALMPILGLAGDAPSRAVVPWLLVLGGLLGALDCWRLSRRLQTRMDAHTRDRWLPQRVELFARGRSDFVMLLGCLTVAAVVLVSATLGIPNTSKRPAGLPPPITILSRPGPDGEPILTMSEEDRAKLVRYFTTPRKQKLSPLKAAVALAIPVSFGLLAAMFYFRYRRDGRPSLVLDGHGIYHAWIGRVPWTRVQGLSAERLPGYASEGLLLLMDDPEPLLRKLPQEERQRQGERFPAGQSPAEIVLSLDAFDADSKRLLSVARRLRDEVFPPPLEGWERGMVDSEVQALLRSRPAAQGEARPAVRPPASTSNRRPVPVPTPELSLTVGDRLSIVWVTLVAAVGAAQLLAMTLFGQGLWLLP